MATPIYFRRIRNFRRLLLKNHTFSIISDNCWGGNIYKYFNLPFSSPFIGLFIFSPDYIRMLKNLKLYLETPLTFIDITKSNYFSEIYSAPEFKPYPVGILKDIEIHFLHYKSELDAREKWNRRTKRVNYSNLIIKFCDRDLATPELISEFDSLHFSRKVCLTAMPYNLECCLKLKNENGKHIMEENRNFRKTISPVKFLNSLY